MKRETLADNLRIEELKGRENLRRAFPLMRSLRPHLDEDRYLELTAAMAGDGYRLFALFSGELIVALAGVRLAVNLYYGRYVWVYDLITEAGERSKGYGKKLLTFIIDWGRENNCHTVALASGVQRLEAHRFYQEKMGLEKVSYTFKKELMP
jgi:GNAT superfamily N-acetyltransferase